MALASRSSCRGVKLEASQQQGPRSPWKMSDHRDHRLLLRSKAVRLKRGESRKGGDK